MYSMASTADVEYDACSPTYFECIKRFHKNNSASLKFFIAKGIVYSTKEKKFLFY